MLNIVIFGAPGSGKGTQSELIIKKYGLFHISTGEILREEIANKTPLGITAHKYISQGHLVPDDLVINMLADVLNKHRNEKGFLFDGYPRTLNQGEALDELLRERDSFIATVLHLSVDEKVLIQRLLKRGEQYRRNDDTIDTIKERLEVYKTQTEPLIDYYKKKGKLYKIQGNDLIEEVFESITEAINRLQLKG